MSQVTHYHTIEKTVIAEFKDRGSKFMAYAYPLATVPEFKEKLTLLKKEHPKAVHHCFAYRIGLDGANYRVSDDGEPSGSAGRPILGQIDSKKLTQVLVIVVRYFGGTLLGIPGLINAYKTVTAEALGAAGIIQKPLLVNYRLEFDYTKMNEVMHILKQFNCLVLKQEMQLFCVLETGIPVEYLETCLTRLKELQSVETKKF